MTTEVMNKMAGASQDFKNKSAQGLEDQFSKISRDAGKKIGTFASDVVNSTSRYVNTSRDYVAENPVKGIAIAAAAGAVVGSILTMTMRSSK